jgi:hypothetical protein
MRVRGLFYFGSIPWLLACLLGMPGCGGSSSAGTEKETGGKSGTSTGGTDGSEEGGTNDGETGGRDNETGGNTSTGGSDDATGGTPATGGATEDLTGTWDIVTSVGEEITNFTIVVTPISVTLQGGHLRITAAPALEGYAVTHQYRDPPDALDFVPIEQGELDLGAIPFNVSGEWFLSATGTPSGCTLAVNAEQALLGCGDANGPSWLPSPRWSSISGPKAESLPSMFGDLGGLWLLKGLNSSCDVRFEGSTIGGVCRGRSETTTFNVTFDGDSASGSSSEGLEFSAQRR